MTTRSHFIKRTRRKGQKQTILTMEPDLASRETQFNIILEDGEQTGSDRERDILVSPGLESDGKQFTRPNDEVVLET